MAHDDGILGISAPALLEAVEKATQAGIAVVNSEGVQTHVNDVFCRMLGYTEAALLGQRAPFDYWAPEDQERIQAAFESALANRATRESFELRFVRKDEIRIDVNLTVVPVTNGQGDTTAWLAAVHDVTSHKRAESQLEEAQRLAQIGSWHWDIGVNEVGWSREMYRQFGRDPDSFVPNYEDFTAQIVEEDRARVERALKKTLEENAPYSLEIRIRKVSGEICVQRVIGHVERSSDGRPIRLFGTSQDITEQKRLEQERLDETIHRIAVSFGQELDEQRLLQRITDEATSLADAEFGALFFNQTTPDGDSWMLYTLSGAPLSAFENFPLPRATPVFAPTFHGQGIVRSDDIRADPRYGQWGPQPEGHLPVVSYLAVPVRSATGEVLGGLFFGHPERGRFKIRHERLVAALAAHAGVALDNARFYKKLSSSERSAQSARIEAERTAAILSDQRTALELIASGRPLNETLETLILALENHSEVPVLGSVLLLDRENGQLLHGAAPSLPASYNEAIDGVAIGPAVGSCGTAAYDNREVLVTDIATDPLWADYKDLALQYGLRACWSTPIGSSTGQVLGTFAIYSREVVAPSASQRILVQTLNRTAAIAIERKQVENDLREANRRKDEFLAMLGHELRNPLAPILTALELMALRGGAFEKERAVIDRHVRHMMQLVDDLLDVARIVRGKIEIDRNPLVVEKILAEAAEMAGPLIEERGHTLNIHVADPSLSVDGDSFRLAQVFANLLTNAAKYTHRGGNITINAKAEGTYALIVVRDTGMGIPPELLPTIFEPFVQGKHGVHRLKGGLGLGLPLVRSLVALHGGDVTAESPGKNQGTEIRVRIPLLMRTAVVETAQPPVTATPGNGCRILVVDDNEDAALLMAELLRSIGYIVTVAHDGPEALAAAKELTFDIAILDIGLPVMDGYELGEGLLALQSIRLIAVTGYGGETDRRKSSDVGFSAHLVKPVRREQLLAALETT